MMREERLLERISNTGEESARRGSSDQDVALNSIVAHLKRVLNTRQGSVPIDPDYGVPDYHSLASRFSTDPTESITVIENGVIDAVRKHEPRLENASVKMLDKKEYEISMTMEISADMLTENERVPVMIKVVITSEGRIEVSA